MTAISPDSYTTLLDATTPCNHGWMPRRRLTQIFRGMST